MRVLTCLDPVPAQDGSCAQAAYIDLQLIPHLSVQQVMEMAPHIFLFLAVCWVWKKLGQQARA
jgi:hypothetical protein